MPRTVTRSRRSKSTKPTSRRTSNGVRSVAFQLHTTGHSSAEDAEYPVGSRWRHPVYGDVEVIAYPEADSTFDFDEQVVIVEEIGHAGGVGRAAAVQLISLHPIPLPLTDKEILDYLEKHVNRRYLKLEGRETEFLSEYPGIVLDNDELSIREFVCNTAGERAERARVGAVPRRHRSRGVYFVRGAWEVVDNFGRVLDAYDVDKKRLDYESGQVNAQATLDALSPIGASMATIDENRREDAEAYYGDWRPEVRGIRAEVEKRIEAMVPKEKVAQFILEERDRELLAKGRGPVCSNISVPDQQEAS